MRCAGSILLCAFSLYGQGTPDGVAYFEKNIRPLLAANCYQCHSSKLARPMSGLTLDSKAGTLRVVVPGKPDDSLIIAAVRGTQSRTQNAAGQDARAGGDRRAGGMGQDGRARSAHRSAPTPVPATIWRRRASTGRSSRLTIPNRRRVASAEWNQSPIDEFIKAKLDEKKLTPQPRASKLALIRRVTYDLIGLPPTPEEIDAFVKDASPRRFRESGGPPARIAAIRRKVGAALARRGPLCRYRRRQRRFPGALDVSVTATG